MGTVEAPGAILRVTDGGGRPATEIGGDLMLGTAGLAGTGRVTVGGLDTSPVRSSTRSSLLALCRIGKLCEGAEPAGGG